MTKDEIGKLLAQIKIMYPRFDNVDRTDDGFDIHPAVIDSWYQRLGWMEYDRAIKILDNYMESENGNRVPTIALWMNNGKAYRNSDDYVSATWDARHQCIVWKPDPDGKTFELQAQWSEQEGCYIDQEGKRWAFAGG